MSASYLNERIKSQTAHLQILKEQKEILAEIVKDGANKLAEIEPGLVLRKHRLDELEANISEMETKIIRIDKEIFSVSKRNNPDDQVEIDSLKSEQNILKVKVDQAKALYETQAKEYHELTQQANDLRIPHEMNLRDEEDFTQEISEVQDEIERLSFARDVTQLNPGAILIDRYKPRERTKGGIHKPTELIAQEGRSSSWGRVLRIGDGPTIDEEILNRRQIFMEGMFVGFLATNPISSGFPGHQRLQMISIKDILVSHCEEAFNHYIVEME